MQPERADFHVHYTEETAKEIISYAARENVKGLALVGRAEISGGTNKFVEFGEAMGVDVIMGVEYLARVKDNTFVDLIAFGFDHEDPTIQYYFSSKSEYQKDINTDIASKQKAFLEEKGFTFKDLEEEEERLLNLLMEGAIAEKAIKFCELVVKNPLNRKKFEQLKEERKKEWNEVYDEYADKPGYRNNPLYLESKFLWYLYFRSGKEGYFPVLKSADDVIKIVHEAGGVILYSPEGEYEEEVWDNLKSHGIDGIMAWHGGRVELSSEVIKNARKEDLLVLGGSDYHPQKNNWQVGVGSGDMFISIRRMEELRQKLEEMRNGK